MTDARRKEKLVGIEAGRGVAAFLVVLVHVSDMLSANKYYGHWPFFGAFRFGHAGVDFFFVLSGFIIYYIHQNDIGRKDKLFDFCWKRVVRIYPAYWIILAVLGVILVFSPSRDGAERHGINILVSIFLLPAPQDPILGPAWTLRHELLFYTLFGVLIFSRQLGTILLSFWGALILANLVWDQATGAPYFSGLAEHLFFRLFNIEFFFGMMVAKLVARGRERRPMLFLVTGAILFFAVGMFESFGPVVRPEWPILHVAYASAAAMTLYGLVGTERAEILRVPSIMFRVGTASYSIYLLHVIVVMILQQALLKVRHYVDVPQDIAFLVIVAIAVAIAVKFSEMVEQPILRSLRRRPSPAIAAG